MKKSWVKPLGILCLGFSAGLWVQTQRAPETAQAQETKSTGAEERLRQLKIELPPVAKATNTLVLAVRVGDMLYVSGTGPGKDAKGKPFKGRVGQDLTMEQGKDAARSVGLQILSVVKQELGSLDRVERVVKTLGMVQCTADFQQQPQVINGYSDLMVEVFGPQAGKGARSAVGMMALPGGIPVEIEGIFQIKK